VDDTEEEKDMTQVGLDDANGQRFPTAGERAPDFQLAAHDGSALLSSTLLAKGPLILTFYRGAWCRCCQADLRSVMGSMSELERSAVTVLGVFQDLTKEAGDQVVREYGLTFGLAGDADGRTAEAFRLRRTAEETAELEREFGAVPRVLKDDEPWILPMQARFAIRADGVIARSDIVFDYEQRSGVEDIIPLLVT
jgi:peroxiredoxin